MKRILSGDAWRRVLLAVCLCGGIVTLGACSKSDKYKDLFMSQCAIAKPMEAACSCTYERMTAEVPMEAIAKSLEGGKPDPAVGNAITNALLYCRAKYR